ncbi:hypothetical protein J7T55_001605 [Diaporthe amygdali]|uniref:uncharacterized protein n=1 Tax=Phomopsis amygdali TaxID=1214568 RepID=UPI0022FDD63D|nr:uncharacterized protein J7T55_001605 [Diaporthe amygdali]KAJ0115195.1 hypothetical protein J7T55_001605 [Diaporthe amygdali]
MSSSDKGGPLSRWTSNSSTACASTSQHSQTAARRQTWASATWATGQNIITGMLYHRRDSNASTRQYGKYQRLQQYEHFATPNTLPLPPTPELSEGLSSANPNNNMRRNMPTLDLPPLPRLLGNENLDEWDDILVRTLRLHGLAEYVTVPYPGVPEPTSSTPWAPTKYLGAGANAAGVTPEQWERDRALVCLLMTGSFSLDVRDTLLACGYDPSETNPKAIYDLVQEALPKAAGEDVPSWLRELNAISPSEPRFGGSLREYCLRLSYLRKRLYVAEPQPNDNLVLVMAILGLGRDGKYEDLSMALGQQLERGGLSWARFMGDLAGVHGRQVAERRKAKRRVHEEPV